jgi:hypothetical protein
VNRPDIKILLIGFLIGIIGVAIGFAGWHVGVRTIAIAAYFIVAFGLLLIFIGIVYGWWIFFKKQR